MLCYQAVPQLHWAGAAPTAPMRVMPMQSPQMLALDIRTLTEKEIDKKSLSTHKVLAVH